MPRPRTRPETRSTRAVGLGRGGVQGELAGLLQPARLLVHLPGLLRAPRGGGDRVVVLPGHGFGDATTAPLRGYLAVLGHDVHGWGLGRNDRDARSLVGPLAERLERLAADGDGGPVALIGQSLGGFVAREVARHRPDLVARIVTLGTPLYPPASRRPIEAPVTAVWSDADRVVPPGWSIDRDPAVEHVEVGSTHFAMGLDPDVWRIVADRLAPPAGGDGTPASP